MPVASVVDFERLVSIFSASGLKCVQGNVWMSVELGERTSLFSRENFIRIWTVMHVCLPLFAYNF
jgi:hypothetical protein